MMSGKFSEFLAPPHLVLIYIEFAEPSLIHLSFGYPLPVWTSFMDGPQQHAEKIRKFLE